MRGFDQAILFQALIRMPNRIDVDFELSSQRPYRWQQFALFQFTFGDHHGKLLPDLLGERDAIFGIKYDTVCHKLQSMLLYSTITVVQMSRR